jgi:putative glutamine amidotransferase
VGSNVSDRPVIGVTTYVESARYGVWDNACAILPRVYFDAVDRAGGVPVLIPPIGSGQRDIVGRIDGLVLSGGADVDPKHYRQTPHERTRNTRPERDAFELGLFAAAQEVGLPVFAVCRGMQLVNVALGGTLRQHLPDDLGYNDHLPTPGVFGSQGVRTVAGSRVSDIVGEQVTVHCHHHQAVDELGQGVTATAWSDNGVIEAMESSGPAYLLGVQWHPEEDATDDRLFTALVQEARKRMGENR